MKNVAHQPVVSERKSSLSNGLFQLRTGDIIGAMKEFVHALNETGGLAHVIMGNMRLAQRRYRRQQRKITGCGRLLIVDAESNPHAKEENAKSEHDVTNIIRVTQGGVRFAEGMIYYPPIDPGFSMALIVAEHPAIRVHDSLANPSSLLLSWMYRLVWGAEVTVTYNGYKVEVEEFICRYADYLTVVQLSTIVEAVTLTLINVGVRPRLQTSQSPEALFRVRKLTRILALYEALVKTSHEQFLQNLFSQTLDRSPGASERKHYLESLVDGSLSRSQLAEIVCAGEEAQRALVDSNNHKRSSDISYDHPNRNEISLDEIHLPRCLQPNVSVLIPVYGKVEYTMACLASIAANPPNTSLEVIVIDDRSPDDSAHILSAIENITVISNRENLGFLRSCNNGVRHAKGEYLLFLNNDTQVRPGWMDELLLTFKNFPNCGLAGSKLLYPDGRLQEAGGIVWQDGSAWNYGNLQSRDLPEFNYAREVDYVSGAAIMVPRKIFNELGGFDEWYAPAYYEDTDLALRISQMGKSVIYQPLSEVVHFEGVSSGTDTGTGVKAFQLVNQQKFKQRWRNRLQHHRPNGLEPDIERDRNAAGRVLFIDACTPTPDQDSGSIDIMNIMKVFVSLGWAVTFIPEDNYAYLEKYTPELQRNGIQALYQPHTPSVDEHISAYGVGYDLIMAFRPLVLNRHIEELRRTCPLAKIIYNTVDLHFLRLQREAELNNDASLNAQSEAMKKIELSLIDQAELTTVVSDVELRILKQLGYRRVFHLPFSRDIRISDNSYGNRAGIVFVGGFRHSPNIDAVLYLANDIMPLIKRDLPDIKLHIVGSGMPPEVLRLAQDDVIVHGFVEDLDPLLDAMRVNLAPLRYGAGTKGKVAYALTRGLPTVATPTAVEGMSLKDNADVMVAEGPEDFASKVVQVYQSEKLWNEMSRSGAIAAERNFGITLLRENILKLIRQVEGNA